MKDASGRGLPAAYFGMALFFMRAGHVRAARKGFVFALLAALGLNAGGKLPAPTATT